MNPQEKLRSTSRILETKLEHESWKHLQRIPFDDVVYVVEWITDGSNVYAIGPNQSGKTAKFKVKMVGLYGVTNKKDLLTVVMNRLGLKVESTNILYYANNCKLLDMMQWPDLGNRCELVFIPTNSYVQAEKLFKKFKYSTSMNKFLAVPHYYDPITFVQCLFQTFPDANSKEFVNIWMDKELNVVSLPKPIIPWISFDIETVSTDSMRVPTGEDEDDELFSVSIHHSDTNILYSLVYIPIDTTSNVNLHKELISIDKYEEYENVENKIEVFNNERDLLVRTINLLTLNDRYHFLLGYNSTNYDIKFLLVRSKYLNVSLDCFRYSRAFHLTYNQVHLDIFKIVMMKYDFSFYTLNHVVSQILKTSKADVDAVALRYTFHYMKKTGKLHCHNDYEALKIPSLRDVIHYNNVDTLLVYRLCKEDNIVSFSIDDCQNRRITLGAINKIYNTKQFKIMSDCFTKGLTKQLWFGSIIQDDQYIEMRTIDDVIPIEIDVRSQLQTSNTNKKAKYPGGINFCCKEIDVPVIQEYDYRIAYPLLLERGNISTETCTITFGSVLFHLIDKIPDTSKYVLMDYQPHTSTSKTLTRLMIYKYIYWQKYCGGMIPFTKESLHLKLNNLICVIYIGRVGVLSPIITMINDKREQDKARSKMLDSVLEILENEQSNLVLNQSDESECIVAANDESEDDDFNNGSDFEDDDDFKGSDISNKSDIDDFDSGSIIDADSDLDNGENVPIVVEDIPDNVSESFEDGILILFNDGSFKLDKLKLADTPNAIEKIGNIIKQVSTLKINAESAYRLQKANSASIYGCLGPLDTIVAACITCLIRTFLLQSCQFLIRQGCEVLYCDTDSIMIKNDTAVSDYSSKLNSMFPWTDIECKTKKNVYFVQTKTYYKEQDGHLVYSQHKNGPHAWKDFVNYVYLYKFEFIEDVEEMFTSFFKIVYDKMQKDILYVSHEVKVKATYVTDTPGKVLKDYIAREYPTLSGQHKYSVFNYMNPRAVLNVEYKLSRDLKDPSQVNLFKFFLANFKTAFNLIKRSLRLNNNGIQIVVSAAHVRNIMLRSFLDLYDLKFKSHVVVPQEKMLKDTCSETYLLDNIDDSLVI